MYMCAVYLTSPALHCRHRIFKNVYVEDPSLNELSFTDVNNPSPKVVCEAHS